MSEWRNTGAAVEGHTHGVSSLAPPALYELWSTSEGIEEFDFLAPLRLLRQLAAIGGMTMLVSAVGIVGLAVWNGVSGAASSRTNEPTPKCCVAGTVVTVAVVSQPNSPQVHVPYTSTSQIVAAPQGRPQYKASNPVVPVGAKAKLGRERTLAKRRRD